MHSPFQFATKLLFAPATSTGNAGGTPVIVKIARVGISVGLAVMLISVSVVTGFQEAIKDKVSGFGAHITITNYDNNESLEPIPIPSNPAYIKDLKQIPEITHIQTVATKAGIIRVKDNIDGVVVKGIGADYDWTFFKNSLVAGTIFPASDTAKTQNFLISQDIANRLGLTVGDALQVFFIQNNDRLVRKFKVTGIYKTGFSDYDRVYVLADIAHIKRLNNWETNQAGMIEISIKDFRDVDAVAEKVNQTIGFDQKATTIAEQRPWIFDWLNLLDTNAIIIIFLMIVVSGITMLSAMLTLILEKTSEIGLLKTMGMNNSKLSRIFMFGGFKIAAPGIVWGNIIGLGLLAFQYFSHIMKLDEASYYVSFVPVTLSLEQILFINLISITYVVLSISLPLFIISSVSPLKAIKYK